MLLKKCEPSPSEEGQNQSVREGKKPFLKEEKKQFLIFIGIGCVLGFALSSFFYFLASYYKPVLNILAILMIAAMIFRSFWIRNKKCSEKSLLKRIAFIVPIYFSVICIIIGITVFLPNALKTKNTVFFALCFFSLIVTGLFIYRMILRKNKGQNQNGKNS